MFSVVFLFFIRIFAILMSDVKWVSGYDETTHWIHRMHRTHRSPKMLLLHGLQSIRRTSNSPQWRCDETPHRAHRANRITSRRERRVSGRFAPSSVCPIGSVPIRRNPFRRNPIRRNANPDTNPNPNP